ncbi:MAG: S41 family peptidase [Clostridia bacterium]|nr:S41 family peptidase [Clostridia bacterium]
MNRQDEFLPPEPKKKQSLPPLLVTVLSCVLVGLIVFAATFFSLTAYYSEKIDDYSENYVRKSDKYDAGLLEAALGLLDANSIFDLPDRTTLTETMIEAAISAMGDRYGTFFTDAEYAAYSSDLAGSFVGIGVTLQKNDDGNALVLLVHAGSPAEDAGLLAGDVLISVGGIRFADGYDEAFDSIVGEAGSTVEISFLRAGASMSATVTRAEVVKQTVISRIETYGTSRIGYVHITGFDGHTYEQFQNAVSGLENEGVDALIFDVRSNGGGLLSSVGKMLAYLLPDGVIAYVDYKSESLSDYTIASENGYVRSGSASPVLYCEGGHRITVPAAVLVNSKTASAAELFTAALRDYATPEFESALDVTVVGTTTYGKGTVQTTYSLGADTALKMTVARYSPPSNVNYDGVGIEPGTVVELTEEQEKISVYLRTQENDPQLCAALALLDQKVNP